MSFWLFSPTSLLSSKNVLIYNISNLEELMNFFSIVLIGLAVAFKDKLADETWRKIFIVSFIVIFVMGVLLHMASAQPSSPMLNKNEFIEGIEIPKFSNSLTIDN